MALGLLCLGLTLLGILQTQAQEAPPAVPLNLPIYKVPLQMDFKDYQCSPIHSESCQEEPERQGGGVTLGTLLGSVIDPHFQFQGKWYTIAVADNTIRFENITQLNMYSTIFELKDAHSYSVTSRVFSNLHGWLQNTLEIRERMLNCEKDPLLTGAEQTESTFLLTRLGMTLAFKTAGFDQIQSLTVRVTDTDYEQFATIFVQTIYKSKVYIEIILLGRTKELSLELKESFLKFSKYLGLSDEDIIFTDPIGNVQLGRRGQNVGSVRV
ncbi:Neutrophil gelatinase-associated lipocalin [Fukomys damarensis]|uniref:Neutrophil gelatinase-associated lipocalin n=1 Tax=Fukomys damarensis TaxID=885580 RepID=A0A091E6M2_FUKDA|nr:Neutrophil gelatinase-associated lipocalin [Fukomys damarensis]